MKINFIGHFIIVFLLSVGQVKGAPLPYELAQKNGVPLWVLQTVLAIESGRVLDGELKPWPFTINIRGKGFFFSSKKEACDFINSNIDKTTNIDIGLGQINWHWNKFYFRDPCDLLDTNVNIKHVLVLLRRGYNKKGNWPDTVGWYHYPKGGEPALKYIEKFNSLKEKYGDNIMSK